MKRLIAWFKDSFSVWHDWQFRDVNWINFSFLNVYYERSNYHGGSEIEVALLGVHLRFTWVHDAQECEAFREEMNRRIELAEQGHVTPISLKD